MRTKSSLVQILARMRKNYIKKFYQDIFIKKNSQQILNFLGVMFGL
jgi:hypothetical protein